LNVRYTPRASQHLRRIAAYVRSRSPAGARHVGDRIRETIELLAKFSQLGHPGALAGTREMVVPGLPYIIVHRIDPEEMLTILGIYHGSQLRPGQESSEDS